MGSESDDIDAGWDEVPASGTPAVAAAAAPSSVPPAASSTETPFEVLPLVTRRPESYRSSESLSPTEVVAPAPRVEPGALSRFGPLTALVGLAAATVLWFGHAKNADAPPAAAARAVTTIATPPPEKAVPVALPVPAPAPSPVAPSPAPAAAEHLELAPLVLEAPDRALVLVRSVPEGAAFFEAGQRLGTGEVRLNVAHEKKRHLTALLNGYQPLNFKVDGTSPTITVRLLPVTPEPAAVAPAAAAPAPAVPAAVAPAAAPTP